MRFRRAFMLLAATLAAPFPALGGDAFQYKEIRSVCAKSGASAVCVTPDVLNKTKAPSDAQLAELIKAAF